MNVQLNYYNLKNVQMFNDRPTILYGNVMSPLSCGLASTVTAAALVTKRQSERVLPSGNRDLYHLPFVVVFTFLWLRR
ncbi:unnamed protein product [Mesocestoides corti]|uniref:Transmembrane protein n=1 Tax=Mesocestoides corti TaxID=53468 RepID=A0A0R3U7J7_MESCO|nr:unnamed protein product [Mesocestoides corti]